jgi:hypothetical protein
LNGLYCTASKTSRNYNKKDGLCSMARNSGAWHHKQEGCDELSSLRKENEELVDLLGNRDHMLREAKKLKKELRALLEDARTRVVELET